MGNYSFTFDSDRALDVLGVPGRLTHRTTKPGGEGGALWVHQVWISESRPAGSDYPSGSIIRATANFDDDCGNGHNTFGITGTILGPVKSSRGGYGKREHLAGGCVHDEIAAAFPELAPLIRWHLTSSDGPMHYIANTVYHAGDRDHNGLRKGESRQIINGRTKLPCWQLEAVNAPGVAISQTPTGEKYQDAETVPLFILDKGADCPSDELPPVPALRWVPMLRIGEGKERDLDAARRAAIWPDATDAELSVPPAELKAALEARAAGLAAEFRADMERAGFIWEPRLFPAPTRI